MWLFNCKAFFKDLRQEHKMFKTVNVHRVSEQPSFPHRTSPSSHNQDSSEENPPPRKSPASVYKEGLKSPNDTAGRGAR